jgi:RHH-type transcriptional regulator, rel operon repressor / antitoxin RelB
MVTFRLSAKFEDELVAIAKKTGRSKTFHARQAIINYFENLESITRAEKAWDELLFGEQQNQSIIDPI